MHIEAELIQRCRTGDRQAQHAFFERTSDRIYALLLRISGNADDALDLTQETYIRAFTHIGEFDGRASVLTWLHRIAVNEALQLQRRARVSNGKHRALAAQNLNEHDGNGRLNLRFDMETALSSLAETDRVILLLRYQEGCHYRTLAEIMDLPAGTVASRLSRARDQLRMLLKKGYGPGEEETPPVHQSIRGGSRSHGDNHLVRGEVADYHQ